MTIVLIVWLVVALLIGTAAEQTMIENAAEAGERIPVLFRLAVSLLVGISWPVWVPWMILTVVEELLE